MPIYPFVVKNETCAETKRLIHSPALKSNSLDDCISGARRDGSVIKSTCCPGRGPKDLLLPSPGRSNTSGILRHLYPCAETNTHN